MVLVSGDLGGRTFILIMLIHGLMQCWLFINCPVWGMSLCHITIREKISVWVGKVSEQEMKGYKTVMSSPFSLLIAVLRKVSLVLVLATTAFGKWILILVSPKVLQPKSSEHNLLRSSQRKLYTKAVNHLDSLPAVTQLGIKEVPLRFKAIGEPAIAVLVEPPSTYPSPRLALISLTPSVA